ncbi:MAG: DUF6046 domain-containing protein [Lachnospiraceae bacterium]|nr:DUF6046 domain-containing protein [Lachnospiraceae bacterium]
MALPQQAPGKAGSFIPIAIDLAAASWGQYLAKNLVRFKQGRQGEAPNWEGRGEAISVSGAGVPLTDRSWWEGRFVLCPVHLRAQTEGGTVEVELVDAVAAVSRERRIVSTALAGRDGTVKEYINEGDWSVSLVVGVQATEGGRITDEYPTEALRELRKILEVKDRIEVASEFLKIFDITHIVIKSYSATQTTEQNYQAVSISAVSDEAVEIYSNEYK